MCWTEVNCDKMKGKKLRYIQGGYAVGKYSDSFNNLKP